MLFVLHALDKPDSAHIRAETRPAHLEFMGGYNLAVAGPLLDDLGNMIGSMIVLDVEDRAAAQAFVDGDPYGKAGLFESVNLHEFKKVVWPE